VLKELTAKTRATKKKGKAGRKTQPVRKSSRSPDADASADRKDLIETVYRPCDHVDADELTDAARGSRPASVAALTDATSPRTIAVTSRIDFLPSTNTTFAALTIASAASIHADQSPRFHEPSASPGSSCAMCI